MKRTATALVAVLAVSIGAWLKPVATPILSPAQAAQAWAAANGLRLERSTRLTADGNYQRHFFSGPDGCRLSVAPLGAADESLGEFLAQMTDREREDAHLLINDIDPAPKSAIDVHLRALAARVFQGRAPQPVLLIGAPDCLIGAARRSLTPWPSN